MSENQNQAEKKPKEKKILSAEEMAKIEEMKKKNKEEKDKILKEKADLQRKAEQSKKTGTSLGMESKKEDFGEWYREVLIKSEMIDYYDVSGCYIFRPWSYRIWELVQAFMDAEFKKLGVQNCYFPLFVTKKALETESGHIKGFAPEVAWVTRSGKKDLDEPIAIRPTSETVMYPHYSKWIRSHKDLPLKLNQWCNVVRWEFKNPVPFIRGREFLWQEGHTVFAKYEEAAKEVLDILEVYRKTYEDLCCVPVTKGHKTEVEKFAGGFYTTTVEAFVEGSGRSVQAATSHCLGQNFSEMFDIQFENDKGKKEHAWQNSWGFSTRSIGVITMVHGDDYGLLLPPKIAPLQVIIIPLHFTGIDPTKVNATAIEIEKTLKDAGIRVKIDDRDQYTPGWKYSDWELKGVCCRLEVGPKDVEKDQVTCVRRDNRNKSSFAIKDILKEVNTLLDDLQKTLFTRAKKSRDEHRVVIEKWEDFVPALDKKNVCLVPFCLETSCEELIGDKSKLESEKLEKERGTKSDLSGSAKSLCIPLEETGLQKSVEGKVCFCCGNAAKKWVLFGRSY
jgi:prolyl-tRNA synthetase